MTNAFSVLSLKRNRSTSTCKTSSSSTGEPVSKLSRLKNSGFSIFSKLSNSTHNTKNKNESNTSSKHHSFIDFFNQYFRSIDGTVHNNSHLRRKNTYESDKNYEFNHYRREARKKKLALNAERNVYTVPTPKKLKSILIKHGHSRSVLTTMADASLVAETSIPIRYSNTLTTNSEDLTAKEFADIAGIRILSEDQHQSETEDSIMHSISSRTPSSFGQSSTDDHHLTVVSHASLASRGDIQPKIWDNDFWLNSEENSSRAVSRNNSTRRDMLEPVLESGANMVEPPILHELRRMGTCGSDKSGVIKKGRFEIYLESGKQP
ncbi:hypothetical protein K501DRAFT_281794 [Backusella circina FSU 941]|nr:hypothetical protein K501DRAFT_281794 [Backusella circina FSU 941]